MDQTLFQSNTALAGNGGSGIHPSDPDIPGGTGGSNGTARGGALYSVAPTTTLTASAFGRNVAAGARLDRNGSDTVDASALSAGAAGRDGDGAGLDGGNGGSGFGGGVYFGGDTLTVSDSTFVANQAIGSIGGAGGAAGDDHPGGRGGAGGAAGGGGLRAETSGVVDVRDSMFLVNYVQGGRGGSGGRGGNGNPEGFKGGDGGSGGSAEGGGISVVDVLGPFESRVSATLNEVYIRGNVAIAGDGGFAGSGGGGTETGGDGGKGGDGGHALGGGVHAQSANLTLTNSTVEKNLVSSGFGAAGGYGGAGKWRGGDGGDGGDGGRSGGGGVASLSGSPALYLSTVVQNHVASGFGGNGGFAGFGGIGGGSGGNGGDGGTAQGGGLFSEAADFLPAVSFTTVALNVVDAGGGGFGAPVGGKFGDIVPIRYQAEPGQTIFDGAARVLDSRFNGPAGDQAVDYLVSTDVGSALGADAIDAGIRALGNGLGLFSAGVAVGSSFAAASMLGIIAGLGTAQVGGSVFLGGLGSAGTTVLTFSAGAALTPLGAFSAGGAVLAIGAAVLTKAIVAGTLSGDWEAAFAYALGDPGVVYPRNLSSLIAAPPGGDEDPPNQVLQYPGMNGAAGEAEGTGIWGSANLRRTLVSDNKALVRTRTRQEGTPYDSDGNFVFGQFSAYYLDEQVAAKSRADVAGGSYTTDGTNFIGAVNSGFADDLKGTTTHPLSARPDAQTGFHGGPLPTLKLLPGSPARQALTISEHSSPRSQNLYAWQTTADIGAWGGPANQAPDAANGPFTGKEDTAQRVPLASDPEADPLQLVGDPPVAQHGTVTIADGQLIYTPAPDWFGQETLTYHVTDGELTTTVTTVINVRPVNDPPAVNWGTITINEDEVTYVDLWDYVTDIDTPKELLQFTTFAANGFGTAELEPDGHTVKYIPQSNTYGQGSLSFGFTVVDPGDGVGPVYDQNPLGIVSINVLPVNDAPVIVLPASPTADEDHPVTLTGLGVTDVDAAGGDNRMQVTLSVQHGTLTLGQTTGLTFSDGDGAGDAAMTLTGNLAAVGAALGSMTYTPLANFNGEDSLRIVTNDLGNFGAGGPLSATDELAITVNAVNDAPVNVLPASPTVDEDHQVTITGLRVTDVDASGGDNRMQVTLTVQHGVLTLGQTTGLTFSDGDGAGDATMTLTGDLAAVGAALGSMTYTPLANFNGEDSLRIVTNDLGNFGAGGPLSAADELAITVNAVNDAPINVLPASPTVDEDHQITITGLGVADVDASGGDDRMQVTLTVQHGTLTLGQTTGLTFSDGDGMGDATMTLTGDPAAVGAALASMTYTPLANFNGEDSLRIVSNDLGNFGAGGPLSAADELAITINAVNDAPVARDDSSSTTDQAPVSIDVLANDTDADLPNDALTIVAVGAPSPDVGSVAISGGKLVYTPAANTQGPVTFTYTVRDQAGAESTATETVNVQDVTQPQVSDILIHYGEQTYSLLKNPDRVLPWVNIDALEVVFSEDVHVDRGDLALTSLNASPSFRTSRPNLPRISHSALPVAQSAYASPSLSHRDRSARRFPGGWPAFGRFVTPARQRRLDTLLHSPHEEGMSMGKGPNPRRKLRNIPGETRTLAGNHAQRRRFRNSRKSHPRSAGTEASSYAVGGFQYDASSHAARWTLLSPLDVDLVLLNLDGDSPDGVADLTGNFLQRGDLSQTLKILPGDFNGDSRVTGADAVGIRNQFAAYLPNDQSPSIFADLNGDGVVDVTDYNQLRGRVGRRLPTSR